MYQLVKLKTLSIGVAFWALGLLFSHSVAAQQNTIVRITTPLGAFSVELFDQQAPITVANFLNYINSGRYNSSVIHRSEPGFVIQGGQFTFSQEQNQFFLIATDPTIQNEPGISNTRGTIAMAKVSGNPNSATSQWFFNLADNTFLDSDNGGFTVFGRVLGEGLAIIDAIGQLPRASLFSNNPTPFPLFNFSGGTVMGANLVTTNMSVVPAEPAAPSGSPANVFDSDTGLLTSTVILSDGAVINLSFSLLSSSPSVVIQALAETVVTVDGAVENAATFGGAENLLTIPELVVGGQVAFTNLVFQLTDAQQLLFTLVSVDSAP